MADDGTITLANATLAAMLGYAAPGELEGRRMDAVLTTGARLFWQTHFFPMVRMQGRAEEVFLILRAADAGMTVYAPSPLRHWLPLVTMIAGCRATAASAAVEGAHSTIGPNPLRERTRRWT